MGSRKFHAIFELIEIEFHTPNSIYSRAHTCVDDFGYSSCHWSVRCAQMKHNNYVQQDIFCRRPTKHTEFVGIF